MKQIEIRNSNPPEAVRAVLRRGDSLADAFAGARDGSFAPPFEVREYSTHFTIQADVPGVKSTSLALFIENDWIAVLGERRAEEPQAPMSYRTYERTYGHFWRAFRLYPRVRTDTVRATLRNGVLTIHLPKLCPSSPERARSAHS